MELLTIRTRHRLHGANNNRHWCREKYSANVQPYNHTGLWPQPVITSICWGATWTHALSEPPAAAAPPQKSHHAQWKRRITIPRYIKPTLTVSSHIQYTLSSCWVYHMTMLKTFRLRALFSLSDWFPPPSTYNLIFFSWMFRDFNCPNRLIM